MALEDEVFEKLNNSPTGEVVQNVFFDRMRTGQAAVAMTNTLARLRREGKIKSRREVRDGQTVTVYTKSTPSTPSGGQS